MVVVESPEWLPPGFLVKFKYKDGRKVKHYLNVATGKKYTSKKEVIRCGTEDSSLLVTLQPKNCDDNVHSSIDKVDAISDKTNDSAAWLPNGWTVEERKRNNGAAYKVYIDLSSGSKFYSKASVNRYLSTLDDADTMTEQKKIDNVDEPRPDMLLQVSPTTNTGNIRGKKRKSDSIAKIESVNKPVPEKLPPIISTIDTGGILEQKRMENSLAMTDNVGEPSPDMSSQVKSKTNTAGMRGKKRKRNPFVMVSVETTTPHDLPSGWIKEIKTSKSGSKMRQDPFYTDPISGYVFRSKPDALRYLKTNDICSCICKPLKRNADDIKSSNPATEKLSSGEEPTGGGESAGTKSPAELETKILKQNQANHDNVETVGERMSCEDAEVRENPKSESDLSKNCVDVAIISPTPDPSTKQQFPESGGRCKSDSWKSKKKSGTSLPLRTSKRLAGSEPKLQSISDLSERLRRAAKGSKVDASCSSMLELANEVAENTVVAVDSRQVEQPPPTESSAIPEEPLDEKVSEKPLDNDQRPEESQLCYDFGDSWSDPLEFALKTLTGEIPIDDTLTFPSCFDTPCLNQSQFDAPINSPSEFTSKSGSVDQLPASSASFSAAFGNVGLNSCSGFNYQPKSEFSKEHNAVNPLPAGSPSFFALGNFGFSSYNGGFNYQPSNEAGKDSQTKFNP